MFDGTVRRRGWRTPVVIALIVTSLYGLQSRPLLADDEEHLKSRVADLHSAMESGDFSAWYNLSSPSAIPGQRLTLDEFKRRLGLEDTYGPMRRWGIREATVRNICGCSDFQYPQGPRVQRCDVLVDFVFNNNQKAEELESWDGTQGQWYWSHTDAREGCAIRR